MDTSEKPVDHARLLNLINDLVLSVSLDGNELLYINGAAEEIYGRPVDDFLKQPKLWFNTVHPDDKQALVDKFRDAASSEVVDQSFRIIRPSGKIRWLQATIRCIYDAAHHPISMGCIAKDITGRVTTELALEEATAIYHALVESLPINVFRKDAEGRFTFANQRYCDTIGLSYQELIGKTDHELYPKHLADKFYNDDRWVLQSGLPFHDVQAYRSQVSDHLFVEVLKAPITDSDGARIGIQGMFWDVTSQKRTEEALREAKDFAVAANQAKNDFLANVSHEIRTPLNAIIGIADLLQSTPLDQSQRAYLAMVQQSGESLLTLINDILDFSKMDAGKLKLDHRSFDLHDRLAECMRPLTLRAHEKGLAFALSIGPEVPPRIFGDLARLRQVLNNLVSNAIKFTEQGEIMVRVEGEVQDEKHVAITYTVTDSGIGIPSEKLKSIFQEFEQVDSSTTRKHGGTGLGLPIASQLVELMQGTLDVTSEIGQGSQFHFTLPCDIDPETSELEIPDLIANMPVLIIDDNETNATTVECMLSEWGIQTKVVSTTDAAIHALDVCAAREEPYLVVVCNASLVQENDFELARWVRMHPAISDTPFILLSSGGQIKNPDMQNRLQVHSQLFQPVKRADLLQAISEVVEQASQSFDQDLLAPTVDPTRVSFPRSLRLLLAEDNRINQALAVGILEKEGHEVHVVDNGQDCVRVHQSSEFDAILMDIQMPIMDGLEATRQIRRHEKDMTTRTPIVALTAHAMPEDESRCLEAGMDHYLSKPIRAKKLLAVLHECVFPDGTHSEPDEDTDAQNLKRDTGPLVDWEMAFETVGGDRELLRELLLVFLEERETMIGDIAVAIESNVTKEIRRTSHAMKGALMHLGASPAAEYAKEIETNVEQREPEQLKTVWRELKDACQQLVRPYRDFLAKFPNE